MTGQTLLNKMELINQELQLQPAEEDVVRGLLALNVAQDYFENIAALHGAFKGDAIGTIATVAAQEYTDFPSGVLRLNRLQMLDTNGLPAWEIKSIHRVGGHAFHRFWPLNLSATILSGRPRGYWTNGTRIYWDPVPAGVDTIRWYGFQRAADITASDTFAYDDGVSFPLAEFAVKVLRLGVDDDAGGLDQLASDTFTPLIRGMASFQRDFAAPLEYRFPHDT